MSGHEEGVDLGCLVGVEIFQETTKGKFENFQDRSMRMSRQGGPEAACEPLGWQMTEKGGELRGEGVVMSQASSEGVF